MCSVGVLPGTGLGNTAFLILERVNKITRNQTRLRFWEKPKKK